MAFGSVGATRGLHLCGAHSSLAVNITKKSNNLRRKFGLTPSTVDREHLYKVAIEECVTRLARREALELFEVRWNTGSLPLQSTGYLSAGLLCTPASIGDGTRRGGSVRHELLHPSHDFGTLGLRGEAAWSALTLLLIRIGRAGRFGSYWRNESFTPTFSS